MQTNNLSKAHINSNEYKKYLKLEGELIITIEELKYEYDSIWDELKGYLTNTRLYKEDVIKQYSQLWNIE